jgi:hypothetical protein
LTGEAFAQAVHTYGDTVYRVASSEGTRVTITVEGSSAEWTLTTTVETVDGMIYTFSSDSDGDSKACLDGTEGETETTISDLDGASFAGLRSAEELRG